MTTALIQIREDQALGAAWRRCEAALPEGWSFDALTFRGVLRPDDQWQASAWHGRGYFCYGPTPTAALEALAERLGAIRQPAAESATDPGPVLTAYAEDYDRIRDRGDLL